MKTCTTGLAGSRSKLLGATAVLLAALVLSACGGTSNSSTDSSSTTGSASSGGESDPPFVLDQEWGTFTLNPRIAEKVKNGDSINYVFSYVGTGIALFSQQYLEGFQRGCNEGKEIYPLNCASIAPVQPNANEQISQIQTKLAANEIDCLAANPTTANSMTAITNQMMDEGIPVFTVGVPSHGNEFTNFTQDNEKEGETAAHTVVEWMEETGEEPKKFALSGGEPTQEWAQGRMNGFRKVIEQEVPGATFVNTASNPLVVSYEPGEAYDTVKSFLSANPDVEFIENSDINGENIDKAISDLGLDGKVHSIAWNVSEGQLDAIEKGTQVALLDQKWGEQAAFGGKACAEFLKTGKILPNTQEDKVVMKAQVPAARKELEAIQSAEG